jgi:protein SCO1/2
LVLALRAVRGNRDACGCDILDVMRLRTLVATFALAALAVSCGGSDSLKGLAREQPLEVGAVTLPQVDAEGDATPFTMKAPPGKLLVVYFGYTSCPDLCPTTLNDVRTALEQMGKDADLVEPTMVTVDPQRDTPPVLNRYLGSFFAEDYRALRTEDKAALQDAESAFLASSSLTPNPDGTYEVSHTASTYVVDENGTVLVEWPFGIKWRAMKADLETLLRKATA